jgi:tetratricopeptide (TPR) repeat protein
VLANGFRIRRWHFLENNFNIIETNQDIPLLLSEGAVLSGPYAPALTSDNELPSFIHLFGVALVDTTLFDRQPITHLAVDISNWKEAVKGYPQLQDVQPIASFWIRDYAVNLYNVSKVFRNPEANRYRESAFEQAVAYYYKGQFDSALIAINPLYKQHRTSKSVALLTADLLYQLERFDDVRKILAELVDRYPTDFNVQLQYARLLQMMGIALNDMEMTSLAQVYYARAVDVNRYKAAHARRLYDQIQNQMQTHMRGGDPTQGP